MYDNGSWATMYLCGDGAVVNVSLSKYNSRERETLEKRRGSLENAELFSFLATEWLEVNKIATSYQITFKWLSKSLL